MKKFLKLLPSFAFACALGAPAVAANQTAYYLFDGDHQSAVTILNGAVVNSFSVPSLGYPVAIRDSIWLGDRDNQGASEYSLDGVATGSTTAAASSISQLLDGTGAGLFNYGVTCCRGPNIVTVANADWSNQQALFAIDFDGSGIALDTSSGNLFVSDFGNSLREYDLSGNLLNHFMIQSSLVGLAYEEATDSIWGWNRDSSSLDQYSTAGALMSSTGPINVGQYGVSNPFGGEMRLTGSAPAVPEPATWAMMIGGLGVTGAALRRRKAGGQLRTA